MHRRNAPRAVGLRSRSAYRSWTEPVPGVGAGQQSAYGTPGRTSRGVHRARVLAAFQKPGPRPIGAGEESNLSQQSATKYAS